MFRIAMFPTKKKTTSKGTFDNQVIERLHNTSGVKEKSAQGEENADSGNPPQTAEGISDY